MPERRITGHLARILDGSGQNGRTPGIWPDPAVLVESSATWPENGQDGRLPVNWPGSDRFVPDSGKDRRNPAI
jgi:hypothetical protein